jgi:DNA-binding CsgD family transcriptional regulator
VNARLTKDQVLLIFDLLADGIYTQAEIAQMLDVSCPTISMINTSKMWRHLAPAGWQPAPPIRACGERNGFAKLCADEVREIFRLAWSGAHTLREIGERFDISLSQVWIIKNGSSGDTYNSTTMRNR